MKPFQSKDQLLINESERKYEKKNPKAFIDYLQAIDDLHGSLEDQNPTKKKTSANSI